MSDLTEKTCKACEGGVNPMTEEEIGTMLDNVPGWEYTGDRLVLIKNFKNHYQAMAYVNAIAWISHKENHHPYITVGYNDVRIEYWTHDVDGITENDFICAAKVNEL